MRKKPCRPEEIEKLPEREELLMKKKDFLKTKIDQELLVAKKHSSKNRRGEILWRELIYVTIIYSNVLP